MKVVDRMTFLALPAGTVYAKIGDASGDPDHHYFGEVRIKDGPRGDTDWWSVGFVDNFVGAHDIGAWSDCIDRMHAGGEAELQFETLDSDGLYDKGQKFAVFSQADVDGLIARLMQARHAAFGPAQAIEITTMSDREPKFIVVGTHQPPRP